MSQLISRRSLLGHSLKAGVGLVVLKQLGPIEVVAFSPQAPQQAVRFNAAYQKLDEFIARHMQETGAPGLTLALASRDRMLRVSHYGFADLKAGQRVGPQTLFQIGSISKSFVGVALLQAAEEGKVDLNKPISSYLPWVKIDSTFPPITAHHLLSHTAGLSGVPLLMRVAATPLRTGWAPGTRFLYSNIGYVLLGYLLETVDKRPFAESIRKRILEPLDMKSTEPIITNSIRERLAIGYAPFHSDKPFPLRGKIGEAPWTEVAEAAGSVASTPGDMAAYMRMLLNRGAGPRSRVLSEKSFELLIQPAIKAPFRGEDATYGYGLWTSDVNGHQLLRHTGGMVAFSSSMYIDMTSGFAAFASVNANLHGYRPVTVTRYALDLLNAAIAEQALPPLPPPPPSPEIVKNAADYVGNYTSADGRNLILVANGERLMLEHDGQRIVLEQAGRDRFIVKHPAFDRFALGFGREGALVVEAFHGADWWINERYTGPKTFEYPKEWEAYVGRFNSDSPWYGSTRIVLRKGKLLLDGEAPLAEVEPGSFKFDGNPIGLERVTFDTIVDGKAIHMNFSGIDSYRTYTP
ncbi:MAG TPA: serine hydrolase domain-containing protein [Pyrinomonadaceae bacterium]|nr:serine hydrolase domain-containing protein [Pyrinomonadaceae bacterium]